VLPTATTGETIAEALCPAKVIILQVYLLKLGDQVRSRHAASIVSPVAPLKQSKWAYMGSVGLSHSSTSAASSLELSSLKSSGDVERRRFGTVAPCAPWCFSKPPVLITILESRMRSMGRLPFLPALSRGGGALIALSVVLYGNLFPLY
jgi:hypothetical protein